ncbi:MAG: XrtA system polysaccharide chain length determinant [Congregibacter sp.]
MQESIAKIMSYALGIWRHKWLALGIAWVIAVAGWMYVWKMPEAYQATARVYVDTNSVLRPLLKGLAITPDVKGRVRMMSGTLFSRPNLEKLARMTDLDLLATSAKSKEAMINRLRSSISLSGERRNRSLYNITVTHPDRETARRVAQSLITVFIESSLSEKRDDSSGAQSFLDEQISDYEQRLIEAENRLAKFKQQNVDVLPSAAGGDYYSRLQEAKIYMQQAELELEETENRRDELRRQLAGEGSMALEDLLKSGMSTPTDSRIQQMRIKLDSLLSRYTDKHPEVRQLRGLIEELETQRTAEYEQLRQDYGGNLNPNNPLYQDVRTLLAESEGRVAELKVRVLEYQRRSNQLSEKVNQIPEIEAQLKQLDRDYSVIRGQHENLLKRRESARISQDVEDNASDVTFRVIDPPFVPLRPSEPNKLLFHAMVLIGALGVGAFVGLVISMLRPIVADARMLAKSTGLPLLGVVTDNKDNEQVVRDRWRLAGFASFAGMLFIAFTGVLLRTGVVS